ncbi:rhomboid family intramembrane serine protease [Crocinitomicaceae bacterium]|nr:rhomboid family intramembrane serine protease [Crocinitomicaceae bacterium]
MPMQRSFIDDLKNQYKSGGVYIRLIFLNVAIFLLINLVQVFGRLSGYEIPTAFGLYNVFTLQTSLEGFITHPWGIFTSIIAHFSFLHLLFNMVFLYFSGRYFEQALGGQRLFHTYIVGGVAGGLLEIIAHLSFPGLQGQSTVILGASGSIMAIFIAVAFYQPNLQIRLLTLPPFKIIWLALFYIAIDFISLAENDGTAHFAHLGGALVGIHSVRNLRSSKNLVTISMAIGAYFKGILSSNRRTKLKVVKKEDVRSMSDEEYNQNTKAKQEETNRILDKISKSGYDSLTKREKDFLFNQSNNG